MLLRILCFSPLSSVLLIGLFAIPFLYVEEIKASASPVKSKVPRLVRSDIGSRSETIISLPDNRGKGILSLTLAAKFQQYNSKTKVSGNYFDKDIFSPKSVRYSKLTDKVYVNSLEGLSTVIYDPSTLTKISKVRHRFKKADAHFFMDDKENKWAVFLSDSPINFPNRFYGKPVELAETHGGRYLWSSYYRRSYDLNATLPSAVAIIDTRSDRIVRVMSTGPLPKSLAVSPDGKWVAVVHWGNNTVGFIDVSNELPTDFSHSGIAIVEKKYSVNINSKVNRDKACGYCLRGGVFTPDSKYLLVGRMKGGGIAVIDVEKQIYIGTVYGMKPTPRHLVLSPDNKTLYLSSNISGYVSSYRLNDVVTAALEGRKTLKPLKEVKTGTGTRTIDLSPDGKFLFAAIKYASKVVVIDTNLMKVIMNVPVDSYPVGLDVSPDGKQLWVTSQGAKGYGGNSVNVFKIILEKK